MLCSGITEEEAKKLDSTKYISQRKYDGERLITAVIGGEAIMVNRREKICNLHFREVVEDFKKLNVDCILDGEVISPNDDFALLQRRALTKNPLKIKALEKEVPVKYMLFDVLKIGTEDLRGLPLLERLARLQSLISPIKFDFVEVAATGEIKPMLELAHKEDREGIIVKDLRGIYEGRRSKLWKKLKFFLETTLIVSKYELNPKGMTVEDEEGNRVAVNGEQHNELKGLIDTQGKVEIFVQFLEKTPDNRLRFPSYRGIKRAVQ